MPRVLITGAAGFIGMHTVIRFLKEGWDVIGLDNLNDYYATTLKKDRIAQINQFVSCENGSFLFFEDDLLSDIWLTLKEYQIDSIIHLAAQAGVRYSINNPWKYIESNILGFQKVLDFVKLKSIKVFLYASSSSVYGKSSLQPFSEMQSCNSPESYYAATKITNELMASAYAKTHAIGSIGLRFFTVYGPWGRPDMAPMLFADACLKGEEILVFNYGKQKRDFTYIDDVVEGIYRLCTMQEFPSSSMVCNIGNGSPTNLLEFIKLIEKHMGVKLQKKFLPAQIGDVEETYANIELLSSLINFRPMVNIDKGIENFITWYRRYNSRNN